ncbi:Endodeoxyribonuclease RusA [compost metagenome]
MTQRSKWNETSQKYLTYKHVIGVEARKHVKNPLESPVLINVNFYYPIPVSFNKAKREQARTGQLRPITKPDLDNVVKGLADSLNKIAWKDDNQIVSITAHKYYADEPKIEIQIEEVEAA